MEGALKDVGGFDLMGVREGRLETWDATRFSRRRRTVNPPPWTHEFPCVRAKEIAGRTSR